MKRSFDVITSASLLVVLSPMLLCTALVVRVFLGGPVFFRQKRPGLGGQPFELLKFRTMSDIRGRDGILLSDRDRLGALGKLLRASSIDELPELWNVLRGDMSLVGPRPLLMEYLPLYSSEQLRRHEVRPGLTGWAQINGRNGIGWEEKFRLDVWYIDHRSGWLDLKIIFLTFMAVLRRQGINAAGETTMPRFKGGED